MPTTVNGIGTRYSGKSELSVVQASCPFCNRYANLSSYTTREFVCFVYIPIIPLGRYRIVNQCAVCKRHYRVPFAEYQQRVEKEIGPLRAAAERAANDPAPRIALIAKLVGFQMLAEAEAAARAGLAVAPRHAGLNRWLAHVLALRGDGAGATPFYQQAAAAAPSDPEIRYALGRHLASRGENALAVQELTTARRLDPANVQVLYFLGDAHLAEKQWTEALEAFQQYLSRQPQMAANRDLLQRIHQCKEALGVPLSDAERKAGRRWWPFGSRSTKPARAATNDGGGRRFAIALGVVLGGVCAYFLGMGLWNQYRADVWFDNGLKAPVRVTLDKESFVLQPGPPVAKAAGPGSHSVVVTDLKGTPIEHEAIKIPEIGLLDAAFTKRFFVYNVAAAHVYQREEIGYAKEEANRTYKASLLGLDRFVQQDDVDYVFDKAPDTIEVDSASSTTRKVAFNVADVDLNHLGVLWFNEGKLDDAERVFRRALEAEPCAPAPWSNLLHLMSQRERPPEKIAEQTRAWLAACPTSIEAHRAYQRGELALGHREPLLAEYRARRDAHPEDGASQYLYARLVNEPEQAVPLYREAVRLDPALLWAQEALAMSLLSLERDAESMEVLEKVVQTPGHDATFEPAYAMAAVGAGAAEHAGQVLEALDKQQKEKNENLWQARWIISLALGRYDAAAARLREHTQKNGESADDWLRRTQLLRLQGDTAGLAKMLLQGRLKPDTAGSAGTLQMEQALIASNWTEAVKAIDELKPADISLLDRLYAAMALLQGGDRKAANERLSALEASLAKESQHSDILAAYVTMARYLEGKEPAAAVLASARRARFEDLAHAYFVLASARAAAGDAAGARALFEKSRHRALSFDLPYFVAAARANG